jgi:Domain of unknown function (DUF4258)
VNEFLERIRALVSAGQYEITAHAYRELNNDKLIAEDVVAGLADAVVVEAYPGYHKGPSMLVLQHDRDDKPVHALWGIAQGTDTPVYLVTAYRPNPSRWSADFLERRPK